MDARGAVLPRSAQQSWGDHERRPKREGFDVATVKPGHLKNDLTPDEERCGSSAQRGQVRPSQDRHPVGRRVRNVDAVVDGRHEEPALVREVDQWPDRARRGEANPTGSTPLMIRSLERMSRAAADSLASWTNLGPFLAQLAQMAYITPRFGSVLGPLRHEKESESQTTSPRPPDSVRSLGQLGGCLILPLCVGGAQVLAWLFRVTVQLYS